MLNLISAESQEKEDSLSKFVFIRQIILNLVQVLDSLGETSNRWMSRPLGATHWASVYAREASLYIPGVCYLRRRLCDGRKWFEDGVTNQLNVIYWMNIVI